MTVLAHDPIGAGRVVEVLGDLAPATHVAVVVPGNDHDLRRYPTETGGAAPRANGLALHAALRAVAPDVATAVLVWLGYRCPRGFIAGARARHAIRGAAELQRTVAHLPEGAQVTLIGHSYGSIVCAMAAREAPPNRVTDVVALASPGLRVSHAGEVGARVWATRAEGDWVRRVPRGRLAGFGHGRQPTDPGYGARTFSSSGVAGHSAYYADGASALRNLARIVAGRHDDVT